MMREILPTHGDKEIILPTIEATKRGVTKGKRSLKRIRADIDQHELRDGQNGAEKVPRDTQPF